MGKCEKLKWNRRKLGLTQEDLSKKIGISANTISKLERDETAWAFIKDDTADAVYDILTKLGSWQCNLDNIFEPLNNESFAGASQRLIKKRKELEISQETLGNIIGVSRMTIGKYETQDEYWRKTNSPIQFKLIDFINGKYDSDFVKTTNNTEEPVMNTSEEISDVEEPVMNVSEEIDNPEQLEESPQVVFCNLINILSQKMQKADDVRIYASMIGGLCEGFSKVS